MSKAKNVNSQPMHLICSPLKLLDEKSVITGRGSNYIHGKICEGREVCFKPGRERQFARLKTGDVRIYNRAEMKDLFDRTNLGGFIYMPDGDKMIVKGCRT